MTTKEQRRAGKDVTGTTDYPKSQPLTVKEQRRGVVRIDDPGRETLPVRSAKWQRRHARGEV